MTLRALWVALAIPLAGHAAAPWQPDNPWQPDLGNGKYKNPVLFADYSDPDAVRVGEDYYLTASSFHSAPGLPILHSKDLVNWQIIGHALPRQVPEDVFRVPQHGKGVWAPAIRHHAGKFWIYYPDPDFGLYVITAENPDGPWSKPVLVKTGKGLIDPAPFWDDDGKVYLIHGWAASRAGIGNILTLHRMSEDGTRVLDEGRFIIDGNKIPGYKTLEGPKLYKHDGWYYVFAPAGGVETGWQSVFRARDINGPYKDRIVMDQGHTAINGPHQGALVDTATGQWWFLHFQQRNPYGRIVHLQPVVWKDGWPVIGSDPDGDGKGEPIATGPKPDVGKTWPSVVPETSDEFAETSLGLQWQWQANPDDTWFSLTARPGSLRLFSQKVPSAGLRMAPAILMQKFPAPEFVVTTKVDFSPAAMDEVAGLFVSGPDYAWIGLVNEKAGPRIALSVCRNADKKGVEKRQESTPIRGMNAFLRVTVSNGGACQFAYSIDGKKFTPLGKPFQAQFGKWVGAKVGLFAAVPEGAAKTGHADFEWFRVEPLESSAAPASAPL